MNLRGRERTEVRQARPVPTVHDCLKVRMRLHPEDDEWHDPGSLELDPTEDQSGLLCPEFEIATEPDSLKREGLRPEDLVIVLRTEMPPMLHKGEVIARWPLGEVPPTCTVPSDYNERLPWRSGVRLSVCVVLGAATGPFTVPGAWIARADFRIAERKSGYRFQIERWEPDRFVSVGLPSTTAYWLDLTTVDFNQPPRDVEGAARLAIREDVYDALVRSERTEAGRALQSVILAEVVTDMIIAGVSSLDGDSPLEGSVLHGMLSKLSAGGFSQDQVVQAAREGDRAKILAFVQASQKIHKTLAEFEGV